MEEHYLAATDWVFLTSRSIRFSNKTKPAKLYCECGRELKCNTSLNRQNRKDPKTRHQPLCRSPACLSDSGSFDPSGNDKVDLALDELLWLKQKNIDFPEGLWQNTVCLVPKSSDETAIFTGYKLAQRLAEFRQVEMPIYIADYQALENEIKKISEHINGQSKATDKRTI